LNCPGETVISKYAFHAELISALRHILPSNQNVNAEVRGNTAQDIHSHLDILISTNINVSYELTSNTDFLDNAAHARRFLTTYKSHQLSQKGVIHFTEDKKVTASSFVDFPGTGILFVNVWYSSDARMFEIHRQGFDPISVEYGMWF